MQAWDDFLLKQEPLLGKDVVEKWLRTMKVVHFDSGNLYLEAKDSFQVLWFEEHLRPTLKSKLLNNNFRPVKVHISVGELKTPPAQAPAKSKTGKSPSPQAVHYFLDKIDPSLTLENFVPGETNKILFKLLSELTGYDPQTEKYTAPSVALGAFNPIYLWGGSGSGKTHLLMALAQAFKGRGLNPLYARAETFTEHVVAAIRGSEMQVFRKAYRHADILLIDDVHVFSRKDATQEEFFHTFNTLHTSGRQVILSANCIRPPQRNRTPPRLPFRVGDQHPPGKTLRPRPQTGPAKTVRRISISSHRRSSRLPDHNLPQREIAASRPRSAHPPQPPQCKKLRCNPRPSVRTKNPRRPRRRREKNGLEPG